MYAAIRSPIVAGVTLVGASTIAVSPIAAKPPDIQLPPVRLTATAISPGLENPIDVFTPIVQQTLQDIQSLLIQESNNPFPIVRAGLLDLTGAFGSISPVPQPFVGNAVNTTTVGGALGTVTDPVGVVAPTVQGFLQRQLTVASQLLTAVPAAAGGVVVSTINALVQTTIAVLRAGVGVVGAVLTLNPVRVVNSVINGTALVANVVEQTTIGVDQTTFGQPQLNAPAAADVGTATVRRIPSIAESLFNGRRMIANALSPQRVFATGAPVASAQFAALSTTPTPAALSNTGTPAASGTMTAAPALSTTGTPAPSSTTAAAPTTVAAAKATAERTTGAHRATKDATAAPRHQRVADEVKSTVTNVEKASTPASTAAAK